MRGLRFISISAFACVIGLLASCGGTGTTTSTTSTNAYAAAYMAIPAANWGSGVTVSFPSSCSMTVTSTGVPPSHNVYYLGPATNGQTIVATTPSGIQLAVTQYSGGLSTVNKVSATFNICPTKATSTTAAQGGAIGFITSGEVLFDPYEATNTVALGDDVSYTFASTSTGTGCTGTMCTAYFIDQCNSHAAAGGPNGSASTWHYHGVPTCWTSTVDGTSGASHIIGIALDGYPIYGGRDVNGNVISASSLDACNGITSATPEFPSGAYHYVLPIGVTTKQSSLGCYTGTVGATITAWAQQLKCKMLMGVELAGTNGPHWVPALPPLPGSVSAKNLEAMAAKQKAAPDVAMPGMNMASVSIDAGKRHGAM